MHGYIVKYFNRFFLSIVLLLLIGGCATLHQKSDLPVDGIEQEIIIKLIAEKAGAVNADDLDTFLEQIDRGNEEYYIEQKRWFNTFQSSKASNYALEMVDVAKRNYNTYVTKVNQSYTYGPKRERRKSSFHLKFVKTENGWKDSDLEFTESETEHFIIKGMTSIDSKTQIRIGQEAEDAYEKVISLYGFELEDKTTIKLYDSTYLIRDITNISIERDPIPGLYTTKGSIKLFIDTSESEDLTALIAHEIVHKKTISHYNNLCDWLEEGLAMYFGNFKVWGMTSYEKSWLSKEKHIRSIKWLEDKNFKTLRDSEEITLCYSISGMIVMHIEDEYGQGKTIDIINTLNQYPQREDGRYDFDKHNAFYVGYLKKAIEQVLQIDIEAFDQRWMEWMRNYERSSH